MANDVDRSDSAEISTFRLRRADSRDSFSAAAAALASSAAAAAAVIPFRFRIQQRGVVLLR
jgi:hypothetical protein